VQLQIKGIQGISTVDYPGKIVTTLFTGGCNFRCPFCQNRDLVLNYEGILTIPTNEVMEKLEQRKGFIDGVCITGGEPTIEKGLVPFCQRLKDLGLLVKVDTNGYLPQVVTELTKAVNYIAIDIKSSPKRYSLASGIQIDLKRLERSIEILMDSRIEYEFRTTYVPGFVGEEDLEEIGKLIEGSRLYALQQFRPGTTLDPSYSQLKPYPVKRLQSFAEIMRLWVKKVEVRGI